MFNKKMGIFFMTIVCCASFHMMEAISGKGQGDRVEQPVDGIDGIGQLPPQEHNQEVQGDAPMRRMDYNAQGMEAIRAERARHREAFKEKRRLALLPKQAELAVARAREAAELAQKNNLQ